VPGRAENKGGLRVGGHSGSVPGVLGEEYWPARWAENKTGRGRVPSRQTAGDTPSCDFAFAHGFSRFSPVPAPLPQSATHHRVSTRSWHKHRSQPPNHPPALYRAEPYRPSPYPPSPIFPPQPLATYRRQASQLLRLPLRHARLGRGQRAPQVPRAQGVRGGRTPDVGATQRSPEASMTGGGGAPSWGVEGRRPCVMAGGVEGHHKFHGQDIKASA
jgi:hypothetical protein